MVLCKSHINKRPDETGGVQHLVSALSTYVSRLFRDLHPPVNQRSKLHALCMSPFLLLAFVRSPHLVQPEKKK